MEVNLDDFEKLQRQVTAATRDRDQAEGGFKQVGKQLEDEFKVKSLTQAEKELAAIDKEVAEKKSRYVEARQAFDTEYESILGD